MNGQQATVSPATQLGVDFVDNEEGRESSLGDVEDTRGEDERPVSNEDERGGDGPDEVENGDVQACIVRLTRRKDEGGNRR